MSGKVILACPLTDADHSCNPPSLYSDDSILGIGSLWRCDCGEIHQIYKMRGQEFKYWYKLSKRKVRKLGLDNVAIS